MQYPAKTSRMINPEISPYSLIQEAFSKMQTMILDFNKKKEYQVLCLINSADTYPNMSKYQITKARIMLIDLYISRELYGNAYDLCILTLETNPKASIIKKMKMLNNIKENSPELFTYSCDVNVVDDNLIYRNPSQSFTFIDADAYDEEFERMLEERLSKLDELSHSEFYRHRVYRKSDGVLSAREIDLLTLEALERSYNYTKTE